MTKRKGFTAEFKREAVRLLEASQKPPADLARELGYDTINCTNGKSNSRDVARELSLAMGEEQRAKVSWLGVDKKTGRECFLDVLAVSTNLAAPVVVQTGVICTVTTALLDAARKS